MTDRQLIIPPQELVQQWVAEYWGIPVTSIHLGERHISTQAARWGADQELEACCEWVAHILDMPGSAICLREDRRPKPPTLNSIALQMLGTIERDAHYLPEITDTIRRALEAQ